jgi:predicted transposase YbfD/YdcC
MHCQRKTVEKIVSRGGNYVIGLKKNQELFHDDVENYFNTADIEKLETAETKEVIALSTTVHNGV